MEHGLAHQAVYDNISSQNTKHYYDSKTVKNKPKKAVKRCKTKKKVV